MSWIASAIREDYQRARRKAVLSQILSFIHRRSNQLLPLEEVRARLNVRGQHYLGHLTVPLDQIIGSEGRYTDFDRRFLPLQDTTRERWHSVDRAYYEDIGLPAVELYKLGDIYFVKDGNHRISVARERDQKEIDAIVTELVIDVPLDTDLTARALLLKEEYSDFLEWTGLADLRPDQRIEFSELGGYLDLVRHINAHRYYLGLEQQRTIGREEAVAGWYDNVYLSVIQAIRAGDVLRQFPGRTEADLYRWIMEHRWYLRERSGTDPGPSLAAAAYAELFGRKNLRELTGRFLRGLFGGSDEGAEDTEV